MSDTVVVQQDGSVIVVQQDAGAVVVTDPATQVVAAQAVGPIGPPGPTGPPGPLGPFLGHIWVNGLPEPDEVVFQFVPGEILTIGSNLANWMAYAEDTPTATAVVRVQVNDADVGALTWAPGNTTPTYSTVGGLEIALNPTDRLSIVCPVPADVTFGRISIRVYATR